MCYHYSPAHLKRLQQLYPDKYNNLEFPTYANGFTHPKLPVITPSGAQIMQWGLVPHWVKDQITADKIANMCLNAKIETIAEKPAFRDAFKENLRCIVPAEKFYEWHWDDEKGKQKTKYAISHSQTDIFYFGGIYSRWLDKTSGELLETYTIITTEANELMQQIHNSKKRMPTILTEENATEWLEGEISAKELAKISFQQELIATKFIEN